MSSHYVNLIKNYSNNLANSKDKIDNIISLIKALKLSFIGAKGDSITTINTDLDNLITQLREISSKIKSNNAKMLVRAANSDKIFNMAIKERKSDPIIYALGKFKIPVNSNGMRYKGVIVEIESDGLIHKKYSTKKYEHGLTEDSYVIYDYHYVITAENMINGNYIWTEKEPPIRTSSAKKTYLTNGK